MAAADRDSIRNAEIVKLDGKIFTEWGRIREAIGEAIKANPKTIPSRLIGEYKEVRNLMTRRHALELERTYPKADVVYEARLVSMTDANGKETKFKDLRIYDSGLLYEGWFHPVEVKTVQTLLDAVSKAGGSSKIVTKFKKSVPLGEELGKESKNLRKAKGAVSVKLEWEDPLTGAKRSGSVEVGKYGLSHVQTYMNMGDGIELTMPDPPPETSSPKGTKSAGKGGGSTRGSATTTRGVETKGVEVKAVEAKGVDAKGVEGKAADAKAAESKGSSGAGSRAKGEATVDVPRGMEHAISKSAFETSPDALSSRAGLGSAIEGAGVMILQGQLDYMAGVAKRDMEDALRAKEWEIERHRSNGDWALVSVTFAVSESPDVFGLATDSYPIFYSATVNYAGSVTDESGQFSPERTLSALRNPPQYYKVASPDAERVKPKKVPPGRVLSTQEYAIYAPYPKQKLTLDRSTDEKYRCTK